MRIVPTQEPPGSSRFGWLMVLGVVLVLLGMIFPPTRGAAVAVLVVGLAVYACYGYWRSRRNPDALEEDVKKADDKILR